MEDPKIEDGIKAGGIIAGCETYCRVCTHCGETYYYFDSPVRENCLCGGHLREISQDEIARTTSNAKSYYNTATASC